MRRFSVGLAVGALVAAAAVPSAASAQGYGVYEQSACPSGRAGTGVAAASCRDGSSIFYNPAAIVGLPQTISVGSSIIAPMGSFTNQFTGIRTELADKVYPIPHLYYVRPFGSDNRWAAGIGVFAPYGLATDWPETFEGRFLGYHSEIRAIYIQPTVAGRITDRLSLGVGVDVVPVSVALHQRIDLASLPTTTPGVTFANLGFAPGTDAGDIKLEGSTISFGAHVGAQFRITDRLTLGARYLVRQRPEIDEGEAEITQIETGLVLAPENPLSLPAGTPVDAILAPQFDDASPTAPLADQGGSTSIPLPDQLVVGLQWRATDRARLLFDYQFTNWTQFDVLDIQFERLGQRVIPEEYEESHGFRFGGEYDVTPATTVRAGVYRHTRAAPPQTVTPSLPTGERSSVTVGLGTRLTQSLGLEAYYQYLDQPDTRGRTVEGGVAENNGLYEFNAHLVGATLALTF